MNDNASQNVTECLSMALITAMNSYSYFIQQSLTADAADFKNYNLALKAWATYLEKLLKLLAAQPAIQEGDPELKALIAAAQDELKK